MTTATATGVLLVLTVLLAWWRLAAWWHGAPATSRPAWWRPALIAVAQPGLAGLLFLTLFPPLVPVQERGVLTIATRGTRRLAMLGTDLVALPETSAPAGVITAPDLATALRRRPGVARLRVLGDGLEPRDIEIARGYAVDFVPAQPPRGLIALALPARVAPGSDFSVGGETAGLRGSADLLDPAGTRVATTPLDADGRFVLTGAARVPGPALFRLRLRDARGAIVEDAAIPIVTVADRTPRVLFLAGAPGPEVKYWRRWAVDAGLAPTIGQPVGAGIDLGERVSSLGPAVLARYDLAIVDERSWAALSLGERGALGSAVRAGLGLLLRATGPLPAAVRAGWAGLGMPMAEGTATAFVRSRDAGGPELTRRVLPLGQAQIVPLGRDAGGTVLAGWRALGRGRVGLDSVTDRSALVTSGHGDRFGAEWGEMVAVLARAQPLSAPRIEALPQAGRRTAICDLGQPSTVLAADSRVTTVLPDAAARGCAGFWPREAGWHVVQRPTPFPFYVYPATALPGLRATQRRNATLALTGSVGRSISAEAQTRRSPGWPWLIAFLAVATALWSLERARAGRTRG